MSGIDCILMNCIRSGRIAPSGRALNLPYPICISFQLAEQTSLRAFCQIVHIKGAVRLKPPTAIISAPSITAIHENLQQAKDSH
jgi:hypothetical protein